MTHIALQDDTNRVTEVSAAAGSEVDAMAEQLGVVLTDLAHEYEMLEKLAAEREEALAEARVGDLGATLTAESAVVQRVAEIEPRRAAIAGFFAERFEFAGEGEPSATWIAERVDGVRGEELREAASTLRVLIERVRGAGEATRSAAETLARHMRGIVASAERQMSHTGAYGRVGRVQAGPAVVSALDVTT